MTHRRNSSMSKYVLAATLVVAFAACTPEPGTGIVLPAKGQKGAFIVNGTNETGWPAVGALTASMQGYYIGEFCTGTLIAPQWILTAAHCVTPTQDFPITAQMTRFFIGNDALPTGSQQNPQPPTTGTFYQADKFYPHPDYSTTENGDTDNDIALVHLAKPVTDVTPIALNTRALDNSFLNKTVQYVGFGATDGINQTGSGVKRSGTMTLVDIQQHMYSSRFAGQGVCFGDSGGPGLYQIDGVWKAIGVNSTVGNEQDQDPCQGIANHARVDIYATWITGITELPPPDCRKDAATCECANACNAADGTCNNDVCQNFDCEAVYGCLMSCGQDDQSCQETCYNRGTPDAQTAFMAMMQCFQDQCGNVSESQFQTCAYQQCGNEIGTCFPGQAGDLTCRQAYDCMMDCNGDRNCSNDCYTQGSVQAQGQLGDLFQCFQDYCSSLSDQAAFSKCAYLNCDLQLVACMAPSECDMLGGDCAEGKACWRSLGTHTDCKPSDGKKEGEGCFRAMGGTTLPCADGLGCVQEDTTTYFCRPVCKTAADCKAGGTCEFPLVADWTAWGYCTPGTCADADQDGTCVDKDCNDGDAAIHPGATEACGNGKDDNCDGATDEGCETCTDADGDGYCADVDCDDGDPDVFPGANELCGNGRDDNCNGLAEEGCRPCIDRDHDGSCADVDCDDSDPYVRPGADETCGNGLDDNCNGLTDEDCTACGDDDACGVVEQPRVGVAGGGCAAGPGGTGGAMPSILLAVAMLGVAIVRRVRPIGR